MKVLITTDAYLPMVNGVVTSIQQLSSHLKELGHDVRILALSRGLRTYVDGEVTYLGSVDADLIYPEARIRLPIINEEVDQLIEWHPDIIHSQSEFSSYLLARRLVHRLDIPIVHTYHTAYEDYTHYFSPSERLGKKIVATASRVFCRQLQAVIAPTEKVRMMLEGYGIEPDRCKMFVVPTGIDPAPFQDRSHRESIREKYGITPNKVLMIAVGRLGKEKNYEEVLNYLARFNDSRVRLLLVGDGPNRAALERQAEELMLRDRVIFAGMIPHDEIAAYYTAADLFVCASSSETQGLTYLEAQAAGLPIICRRDDCLNDVVINGENGWQYENYDEFYEHLACMLENDRIQIMGQNAYQHMTTHYSAAAFASKILEIYREVLDGYTPSGSEIE